MKILTTNRVIKTDTSYYLPYLRYVISDWEAFLIDQTPYRTKVRISSFNPYERRYSGQDVNNKRLLLYRHTAYGDMLMITSVPHYIKSLYPDCIIHVYCDPNLTNIWKGNEFIDGAFPLPMTYEAVSNYHYHILYEGMLENNSEPDQRCCYDDFFSFIGMQDVPSIFKKPYIKVLPEDYKQVPADLLEGKYLVYHLSPANKVRCYPVQQGIAFILEFLRRHKDWRVFVVGTEGDEYISRLNTIEKRVINLVGRTPSFRMLFPIIEKASMVVCPDSSILHLSAVFPHVPVVSLWGIFAPEDRAKYYTNVKSILGTNCPRTPCRHHLFHLPFKECSEGGYCKALASIQPDHILQAVEQILKG